MALSQLRSTVPTIKAAAAPSSDTRPSTIRHLLVNAEGLLHCVPVGEIDWCESAGNYVRIHRGPRTFAIRCTLAELSEQLRPHHFIRISRTTIVNIDRIVDVQPEGTGDHLVRLHGGSVRRLTRSYRLKFMERFFVL